MQLFKTQILYGCLTDTLLFSHNGAHDVNVGTGTLTSIPLYSHNRTSSYVLPSSTNNIQLVVSNGTCTDTASSTITLDNEVKASFETEKMICPEDALAVTNTSTGQI